jgi:hypothetical protein
MTFSARLRHSADPSDVTCNKAQKLGYSAGALSTAGRTDSVSSFQQARRLETSGGGLVTSNQARNELKVTVLSDLAAICKKVAENSEVPDALRANARELVEEFNSLLPVRGKGNPLEHSQGEFLLIRMARFFPRIIEIQSWPADSSTL